MQPSSAVPDDLLERARYRADPLADQTIADIVGPWAELPPEASAAELEAAHGAQWERLSLVTRVISQWQDNGKLANWRAESEDLPPPIAEALQRFVASAQPLPDWADRDMIARAEAIFFDQGVLSCTLLFCASLPECYVVPDLAEVLHTTGQLEQRTDYRIRSTAAMIFPVMMKGGLTSPSGGGVAQVLKVRLIHATVRNLILHHSPTQAVARLQAVAEGGANSAAVAPLAALSGHPNMHRTLFGHGWDVATRGLPCNQEEQAYTLLTFGYVYLRGLRTLGVGLSPADERAVLHTWNVMAYLVGIDRELMVDSVPEAQALFARMQARGRARPLQPDPRPALAAALFDTMAKVIPWAPARPFPLLLSRRLCGPQASADLGMARGVPLLSLLLFGLLMAAARAIDTLGRMVSPGFSVARLVTRVLGYHLLTRLLMDQTRPLKLPQGLLSQAHTMMREWGEDRRAPGWMNALEDRFTVVGRWSGPAQS